MKELGPLGGGAPGVRPPKSANDNHMCVQVLTLCLGSIHTERERLCLRQRSFISIELLTLLPSIEVNNSRHKCL